MTDIQGEQSTFVTYHYSENDRVIIRPLAPNLLEINIVVVVVIFCYQNLYRFNNDLSKHSYLFNERNIFDCLTLSGFST